MGKVWKKIAARVSGILLSAAVMAGCMGVDTAFAVERTYTVKSGDTLEEIAQEQYGSGAWWRIIAELNKDRIKDPNVIQAGWQLRLSADSSDVVERSECSVSKLVKYLNSNADKIAQDSVENFLVQGTWPDGLQVPVRDDVLDDQGMIEWRKHAPQGGYELDGQGNAVKAVWTPQIGEVYDRYGSADGRYTSPVDQGQPYSYEKRSLPYVEDDSSYHQYQVTGDISRLADYVNQCTDVDLVSAINDTVARYYGGDFNQMVVWSGKTAKAFGASGGAVQCEFPLSINVLCELGILREVP